ncbi:MAG: hypothetical protein ICV62_09035 [Cyanobacteria bacterium Co-bin13]|nr:hypothetical protein [Cyanobacteria bacterium Co-bin13]
MQVPPQSVYDKLQELDSGDIAASAAYRQLAQEVLADDGISLNWREAIAERLNQANQLLGIQTVGGKDDSY